MADRVRITGLRETVRSLERLGVDVQDLKAAFRTVSDEVATEARAEVPVQSGALQGTIRPANTKNKSVVRAGTPTGVPYAGAINYGWEAHGIQATEFLTRPANTDTEGKVRTIESELERLIRRYKLN